MLATVNAFLPLSVFHYLLVQFYHKLHPFDKISIFFQDSHFFVVVGFYFGHLTDKESLRLSLALKNHDLDAKIIGTIS